MENYGTSGRVFPLGDTVLPAGEISFAILPETSLLPLILIVTFPPIATGGV